jgi:GTPase SAR1 family protein
MDQDSFDAIDSWLDEFRRSDGCHDAFVLLVGNKCDVPEAVVVDASAISQWSGEHQIPYLMVSALMGNGIPKLLKRILKMLPPLDRARPPEVVSLEDNEEETKCC